MTLNLKDGSGVVTFVRELDAALRARGVASSVLVERDGLPARLACDVVHIHGLWRPFYHQVSRLAQRAGVPVVWSPHGMLAPWALHNKGWKKKLAWWLYQRRDLRRAAAIHVTSELEAGWVARLGRPIVQIPLGTHLPPWDEVASGGRPAGHRLLFVGRLFTVKALDRLIEAWSRVPAAVRASWTLRLVGPDEAGCRAGLEALVARLGVDGVAFAGARFGEDLAAEYRACDGLALVSHTENFGATVVDAFAYGKPVVTSTKTPWREVGTRRCGWWVDNEPATLARALEELMSLDDAARAAMGRRGRAWAEEAFSWAAVGQRMEEAYAQVQG